MINSCRNIYKICEQKLEISDPEKKRNDCLEAFEQLKNLALRNRLDRCMEVFFRKMYKDFIFMGIFQAIKDSEMQYMLNAVFQGNRLGTLNGNSSASTFDQSQNVVRISLALAGNDLELLDKIMPYKLGASTNGRYSSQYNMIMALLRQDQLLGEKAKGELLKFISRKHSVFDILFSKYLLAMYEHNLPGMELYLQEICSALCKSNWIQEEIFFSIQHTQLGRSVSLFAHGMYHLAYYCLDYEEFKCIHMPEHKSFIKEYEEYNIKEGFPKGKNLIDFDENYLFLNHMTDLENIPEVSIIQNGKEFYHDAEGFLRKWLLNMRKNNLIDFEVEGDTYVYKTIS